MHRIGGGRRSPGASKVAILAGAVSGGIVLVLAILAIFICFRRRKAEPQDILTPISYGNPSQNQFISEPFVPPSHSLPAPVETTPYPIPAMPWPQPQSQAQGPTPMDHYSARVRSGPTHRASVTSSGAPLVSPGLSSNPSYSGSTGGPGWLDTTTYRSVSHNSTFGSGIVGVPGANPRGVTTISFYDGSGRQGSSNMAVEGVPSANASSSRAGYYDPGAETSTSAPPAPPVYDQSREMYMLSEIRKR